MFDFVVTLWLLVMSSVARHAPVRRIETIAVTISTVTQDPYEQAVLGAISYYETTFDRGGIHFGVSSFRGDRNNIMACARYALSIIRNARSMCPNSIPGQLGFYHHGRGCIPDEYSTREAATVVGFLKQYDHYRSMMEFLVNDSDGNVLADNEED